MRRSLPIALIILLSAPQLCAYNEQPQIYNELEELTGLHPDTLKLIQDLANSYGFHPALLLGLLDTESEFDPKATGKNNNGTRDRGLGQLNDGTSPWLWGKVFDVPFDQNKLYDPNINVILTAWYLDYLLRLNDGDLHKALTAYNRGQRGMRRLSSPVTSYSQKVLRNFEKFMCVYIK